VELLADARQDLAAAERLLGDLGFGGQALDMLLMCARAMTSAPLP
jgi:hypothetical protein